MKKTFMVFASVVLGLGSLSANASSPELLPAREVEARDGIGHVLRKIDAGREVRIAYFGGSITAMDGWRRLSREWLQGEFPKARFTEIAASIGGTGSGLGVFRLRKDVLDRKPDLVFVEFATNDRGSSAEEIWRNFDGIVLQIWAADPEIDIVFVHTVTEPALPDYRKGLHSAPATAMEMLAAHYGIPSIGFGPRVAKAVQDGRLVMSLGEFATAVPKETPDRDRVIGERLKAEGKVLFAKDGVHPTLDGHGLYLESIKAAFAAWRGLPPADHRAKASKPYFDGRFAKARMVPVGSGMCKGRSWKLHDGKGEFAWAHDRIGDVWEASEPGDALEFTFRGSYCSIYDLIGPACGRVRITVDGKPRPAPVDRFDKYCSYYRLAGFLVYSGEEGVHAVRIELDREQPDRSLVLWRNPKENIASPKYSGTRLLVGQIELVGEL